jgi:CBS domain-containing protein
MIRGPATVPQGSMMLDAVAIMAERKISELPVIDDRGRPRGMIDITDVVALFPEARLADSQPRAARRGGRRRATKTEDADLPVVARFPTAKPTSRKPPGARPRDCA